MKDVLLPGLALAAAHAGDLDTLQAFVELVSSPPRDKLAGGTLLPRAEHLPRAPLLLPGQWACILAQGPGWKLGGWWPYEPHSSSQSSKWLT